MNAGVTIHWALSPDISSWAIALLCKSGAMVLLASTAARTVLRTASQQRLLWALTFGTMLAMPAGELLLPAWQLPLFGVPHERLAQSIRVGPAAFSVAGLALTLWLSGCVVALVRTFNDWRAARGLLARATLVDPAVLPASVHMLVRAMQPTPLRLAWTDELVTPAVIGWRAPTVLLPRVALSWGPDMLRAALVHEIEHIRQRDWLVMLLERVTLALYWPNPLLWMARRAAAMAREIAADDAVIRANIAPAAYAQQLLALSRTRPGQAPVKFAVGLGGAAVAPRVYALFAQAGRHETTTRGVRLALISMTLIFAVPAVAIQPLACSPTSPLSTVRLGH